ncbi:MAG: HEAT repeat domain-containing protein [Planctomycetes bacterium]|nr:HEAT repeat domain-containing protein [Planctomycetota bacterium]
MNLPHQVGSTLVLALSLALFATGCRSSGSQSNALDPDREIKPIGALVESTKKPESIGKFLADTNSAIKAWNNLTIAAQTPAEQSRARDLELHIQTVTHQRRSEIINELESGPLNNRIVAAAALGFTRDEEAQSPLLNALSDRHAEVVSSALIGLWLLDRQDTPVDRICPLLSSSNGEDVRSNAALLLARLCSGGKKYDCALTMARVGVIDPSPTVRAHCTMILAHQLDTDSLQALVDRLYDETGLVASAAARALAHIGSSVAQSKGQAARGLVKAWIATKDSKRKDVIFRAQVELAQSNYGSDEKEWIKWAERLP